MDVQFITTNIEQRTFQGTGTIEFKEIGQVKCFFKLTCRFDGKLLLTCCYFLTETNSDIFTNVINTQNEKILYASFRGFAQGSGNIIIEDMALNNTDLNFVKLNLAFIQTEFLRTFIENDVKSNNLTSICFDFLLMSNIEISYGQIEDDELSNCIVGLTNFDMGSSRKFEINLADQIFSLEKKENYDNIIKQLGLSLSAHVTSYIKFSCTYKKLQQVRESVSNLCQLISFGNGNWVAPMYMDITKDGKVIKIIFYHVKRYPFIRSQYLIRDDMLSSNFKKYLETTYTKYIKLLSGYKRINSIIEFYLSGLSSLVADEKFMKGYLALEILSNEVVDFDNKGVEFIQESIDEMKKNLKTYFDKLLISASDDQISYIANKVAYKQISILKSQKYTLRKFDVSFGSGILQKLYEIRNKLFHGDGYNKHILFQYEHYLFDFLDRTILTMLGWKGNRYFSKIRGSEQIL